MNDRILYRSDSLAEAAAELNRLMEALEDVAGDLSRVDTSAEWWSKLNVSTPHGRSDALGAVRMARSDVGKARDYISDINEGIRKTQILFQEADRKVSADAQAAFTGKSYELEAGSEPKLKAIKADLSGATVSMWDKFVEEYRKKFSWSKFLSGAGYIGTIYDLIQDLKSGTSWTDYAKVGKDAWKFITEAAQTYKNYKKIGNAVGGKKAMEWWAKAITGLKPDGYVSQAKSLGKRFVNNLKNKTSPYNLKKAFGKLTGAEGTGKCVAAWAEVGVDGVINFFSNKAEQAESGGTMSDGRVIAETITETAIGTVVNYGTKAVVGAAVAAVAGTTAAPAIVVAGVSTLIVTGVNAGVEAITGKTATEWASDAILDAGEAVGKAVGKGVSKAKKVVSGWFSKLSFA